MARIISGLLALSLTTTGAHLPPVPPPPPAPAVPAAPSVLVPALRAHGRRRRRVPRPRCHFD
ncbi:hypothetical protein SAMN05421803_12144 [Nocardiopsis flavescens]|uniref:Uncharacterized protein n=1 Tax=Nocardiopsis flavescens TaxID=758803 RepID=A0A1M6SVK8_9ACTN|nr:hypothetical protein [Nocardiopsis flavescens]SHK48754.1 hypothetical protein SAMN05421803_12144 [Nocardiopsis flavescens]